MEILADILRPKKLDDVVGQTTVVKVLKNSISQHKFCHAYMFFHYATPF